MGKLDNIIVSQFMNYQYVKSVKKDNGKIGFDWHSHTIIGQIINKRDFGRLQRLEKMIGTRELIENVLICDKFGVDGLEYALRATKEKHVDYLFSFPEVRDLHNFDINDDDDDKEDDDDNDESFEWISDYENIIKKEVKAMV